MAISASGQLSKEDQQYVDSLQKVVTNATNDTVKINAYFQWDDLIYRWNTPLDIEINTKVIEISEKKLAKFILPQEQLFYKKALKQANNNLGLAYIDYSFYEKALDHLHQSLLLAEELKDSAGCASATNNLGIIYRHLNNHEKALEYYQKGMDLETDPTGKASYLNNIGLCYADMNQFDKAMEYYTMSLSESEKYDDLFNKANTLTNIGLVQFQNKNYDTSLSYFQTAIQIYDSIKERTGTAFLNGQIGYIHIERGANELALEFCKKGYQLALQENSVLNQKENCDCIYTAYKLLEEMDSALAYYEQFIILRDSLKNNELDKEILKKDLEFDFEKQQALASSEHQKQLAIADEKEKRQTLIIVAFGLGALALVVVLVIIFRSLRVVKKQNNVIEDQKREVELKSLLLEEKNHEILDSITYAKRIQEAILPPNSVVQNAFKDIFILYKPKDIVAGDFYWMEEKSGKTLLAVADCTGHGVPGAMVSVVCHNALNRAVREFGIWDPGAVLDKTRELVIDQFDKSEEEVKDGMDISMCCLEGYNLTWAGANNPLWIVRKGELIEYKADKQPIGKYADAKPFTTHTIQLEKEDIIYIFTDGLQDQFGGPKGKKFMASNFKKLILSLHEETMMDQKTQIDSIFEDWKKLEEQIDDVCVIGVRV